MDNEPVYPLEQPFAQLPHSKAPAKLRGPVLAAVHRELAAQQWERRIGQAIGVLLLIGITLNGTVGWQGMRTGFGQPDISAKSEAIVDAAVTVAEATDAETGTCFAQHLAALGGRTLSKDQTAAIQQAIQQHLRNAGSGRGRG